MPKIPMNRQIGMVQHVRAEAPMTGSGLRLKYADDGTAETLQKFAVNMDRSVSALAEYQRKKEYTEDRLAAAEARNLYRTINADLESRMADNPNDYEKFKEWAQDADKRYADGVREFTGKMSADYRKQFEAEMSGIRVENLGRRTRIGIQAKVTADYNLFQSQWKDAALRGDLQECNRMLEEQRGNLISENEYQQKKLDYERLAAFGEVKRALEGNVPGIIGKLKERNPEGGYVNFPGLEEAARDRFIRVAEARDAQRRADENEAFVDQLSRGENITTESINKKFEGDTSPEAQRQKRDQLRILQRVQNARAGYKAKATEAQSKKEFENFRFKIYDYKFSEEENMRNKQYSDLRNEILTTYPEDGAKRRQLMEELSAAVDKVAKPAQSYKNSNLYKDGTNLIASYKSQGLFAAGKKGRIWGVNEKADKSSAAVTLIEKSLTLDMDQFVKEHPNATTTELNNFLQEKLTVYNKSTVTQIGAMALQGILSRSAQRSIKARTNTPAEGRTGTYNGKKVIFKNGKPQYVK